MWTYYKTALFLIRLAALGMFVFGARTALFTLGMLIFAHAEGMGFMVWNPSVMECLFAVVLWWLASALARKIAAGLD